MKQKKTKNLIILRQNYKNHEILRIPCRNHENHENVVNPRQNHENHILLQFHTRITNL